MLAKILDFLLGWITGQKVQREAGRQEQKAADLVATTESVENAREVERTVDAASDPELDQLRSKWTAKRPSPAGDQ